MSPKNRFLAILSILTCASASSAYEYVVWSYVTYPPLLQLVEWMNPALVNFINNTMFMTGPWDHNRLIYSSREGAVFIFLWY